MGIFNFRSIISLGIFDSQPNNSLWIFDSRSNISLCHIYKLQRAIFHIKYIFPPVIHIFLAYVVKTCDTFTHFSGMSWRHVIHSQVVTRFRETGWRGNICSPSGKRTASERFPTVGIMMAQLRDWPPVTHRTSQHYRLSNGSRGTFNWFPIMPRDSSLPDGQCKFFPVSDRNACFITSPGRIGLSIHRDFIVTIVANEKYQYLCFIHLGLKWMHCSI